MARTWDGFQVLDANGRRKYLNAGERDRFLIAADRLSLRNRAFCRVLVFTGCRISEALALTVNSFDTEALTMTIKTLKRRRLIFRVVPVPPELIKLLQKLPPAPDGRLWNLHRVTAWRLIKGTMMRAGVFGPMSCPKGLRHALGIRAAGKNIPPNLIQRWMGDASLNTTSIYLDAVGAEERHFASRMW
jgi:integrase/recombinase XerD